MAATRWILLAVALVGCGKPSSQGVAPAAEPAATAEPATAEPATAEPATAEPDPGDPTRRQAALDAGIRAVGASSYELDRALLDQLLADPAEMARGVRIVPAVKDGRATGFKLYAIRPASIYDRLGLKNGDLVTSINGVELDSAERALEVYSKLRAAGAVSVVVSRHGAPLTLNYSIK
jgi:general secretion pathway protein C